MIRKLFQVFIRVWAKIPILGGLVDCDWENHKDAIYEVGTNLFFATMPLTLVWVYLVAKKTGLEDAFQKVTENGVLFMYSAATLSPIFYIALREDSRLKKFPSRLEHIMFVIVILLVSVFAFGIVTTNPNELDSKFLRSWSVCLFMASILLVYLATAYENTRVESLAEEMASQANRLSEDIGGVQ